MHIQRVQVPDFRVLQDVDITFEKDFVPRIFPLGSLNGGGKSTLLQLIFVLLHCSVHEDRKQYIQNMLEGFDVPEGESMRELATFDIWDGEKTIELKFSVCNDNFLEDLSELYNEDYSFSDFTLKRHQENPVKIQNKISSALVPSTKVSIQDLLIELAAIFIKDIFSKIESKQEKRKQIESESNISKSLIKVAKPKLITNNHIDKIKDYLQSQELELITDYSINSDKVNALVCSTKTVNYSDISNVLLEVSSRIYLAAPSSHIYLFLKKHDQKVFFQQNGLSDYYIALELAKENLLNFFTHNFLLADVLLEAFRHARDKDFKQAVETGGYGQFYAELLKDLSSILDNKKVIPTPELDEIKIKLETEQGEVDLNPEDLSHGEIKKLSLYVWLKYIVGKDSILLIDEIENTLHPDWQYQIADNLKDWGEGNQFILATHSYDICEALTPKHVKELEPKLLKNG